LLIRGSSGDYVDQKRLIVVRTAIIIGAGVTGLSTAYHLARKNYGRILIFDKGPVGDGSSSRAAGIITGLLWSETGVRARQLSLSLFRELSYDLEGYRFQEVGCLNLFDAASWVERKKLLPLYDRLKAPYEVLAPAQIRKRWPALNPDPSFIGLHDPLGGYSEPDDYIPALTRRIRGLSVEINERTKIKELILHHGRVAGVETDAGFVACDAVISTVYAWTLPLLKKIGLQFPVKNYVHQRYITSPLPQRLEIPAVNANPLFGYVRPAAGNRLLLGIETPERMEHRVDSLDFHLSALSANPELKDSLKQNFIPLLPALHATTWQSEKVGLLTFTMDGEPMLGPVSTVPGLFIGLGFHSGGFAYNPASGRLLAESVASGRTSIDLSAFSPDRFDPKETKDYLEMTLAQKDVVRRRH
jgi:glycine/D-amino acid oxidase-like deaminating enzyme